MPAARPDSQERFPGSAPDRSAVDTPAALADRMAAPDRTADRMIALDTAAGAAGFPDRAAAVADKTALAAAADTAALAVVPDRAAWAPILSSLGASCDKPALVCPAQAMPGGAACSFS